MSALVIIVMSTLRREIRPWLDGYDGSSLGLRVVSSDIVACLPVNLYSVLFQ